MIVVSVLHLLTADGVNQLKNVSLGAYKNVLVLIIALNNGFMKTINAQIMSKLVN